jgi:hypothetical protein
MGRSAQSGLSVYPGIGNFPVLDFISLANFPSSFISGSRIRVIVSPAVAGKLISLLYLIKVAAANSFSVFKYDTIHSRTIIISN